MYLLLEEKKSLKKSKILHKHQKTFKSKFEMHTSTKFQLIRISEYSYIIYFIASKIISYIAK